MNIRPTAMRTAFATAIFAGALFSANTAIANGGDPAPPNLCGKFKKGSKQWKECMGQVKLDQASADEIFAKGYWLAKTGDYRMALDVLYAHPNQNDAQVLTMIGFATRHLGRVDEALLIYAKALSQYPNLTNTRQYLGEAYLQKNDVAAAKAELAEIGRICGGTACEDYKALDMKIVAHEIKG